MLNLGQVCSRIVLLPPTAFHIWIDAAELHTSVSLGVLGISKRLSKTNRFYICLGCQAIPWKHISDQLPSFISEVNLDSCNMQTISIRNRNLFLARHNKELFALQRTRLLQWFCRGASGVFAVMKSILNKFHNLPFSEVSLVP